MPPLGIYLKGTKARTQRDSCIPMFTAALFTKAKTLSVHQQVNKENTTHPPHTHTPPHTGALFSQKQGHPTTCSDGADLQSTHYVK